VQGGGGQRNPDQAVGSGIRGPTQATGGKRRGPVQPESRGTEPALSCWAKANVEKKRRKYPQGSGKTRTQEKVSVAFGPATEYGKKKKAGPCEIYNDKQKIKKWGALPERKAEKWKGGASEGRKILAESYQLE